MRDLIFKRFAVRISVRNQQSNQVSQKSTKQSSQSEISRIIKSIKNVESIQLILSNHERLNIIARNDQTQISKITEKSVKNSKHNKHVANASLSFATLAASLNRIDHRINISNEAFQESNISFVSISFEDD